MWMGAVEGRLQWGRERILTGALESVVMPPESRGRQGAKSTAECKNVCVVLWCQKQVNCSGCSQPVGCPFCMCSRSVCRKLQSQVRKYSLPGLPHQQLLKVVSAKSP